jgi:predicted metal-dependent hydrolase
MATSSEYDPRYLAGIILFNRHEFFEAHEVWESLWHECDAEPRRFYQGLIQAAVAIYHGSNGNDKGARRLFHSARKYMSAYPNPYLGLDGIGFWQQMEQAFERILAEDEVCTLDLSRIPDLQLQPVPSDWPAPSVFLDEN